MMALLSCQEENTIILSFFRGGKNDPFEPPLAQS